MPYDPTICDLCGCSEYSVLLDLSTGRSMSSDRKIVSRNLKKYVCERCAFVRSGDHFCDEELQDYYIHDYTLSVQSEHYFYTSQGPISRSKILCDWIISAMGEHYWRAASHCLEIGAGAGMLMQEFIKRFPDTSFEGIELNCDAAAIARVQGLPVYQGTFSNLKRQDYDVAYAVGVIEHVSSPTKFIREIRNRLKPGGWLFLCQPTQDVPSYDLFFFDHLHHFGGEHLGRYAQKCGFRERGAVVGHEWMPNFSLHLWQKIEQPDDFAWAGPPGFTTCPSTARNIVADMDRLDETLMQLEASNRSVAVFGLGEVYCLVRAYSALGNFPIVCGLEDQPNKPEFEKLGFPVLAPEDCSSLDIQDVILTMNKVYYDQASERLKRLGLCTHKVLS